MQETKLMDHEELASAEAWLKKQGWRARWSRANLAPGDGPSGGAAVLARSGVGMFDLDDENPEVVRGHVAAAFLEIGVVGGIVVYSVYLSCDGEKLSDRNWRVLRKLGEHIKSHGCLWLAGGDFNVTPAVLEASGWPGKLGGRLVRGDQSYTTQAGEKRGREIDYFVMHARLATAAGCEGKR